MSPACGRKQREHSCRVQPIFVPDGDGVAKGRERLRSMPTYPDLMGARLEFMEHRRFGGHRSCTTDHARDLLHQDLASGFDWGAAGYGQGTVERKTMVSVWSKEDPSEWQRLQKEGNVFKRALEMLPLNHIMKDQPSNGVTGGSLLEESYSNILLLTQCTWYSKRQG